MQRKKDRAIGDPFSSSTLYIYSTKLGKIRCTVREKSGSGSLWEKNRQELKAALKLNNLTDGLKIVDTQAVYLEARPMLRNLVLCAAVILAPSWHRYFAWPYGITAWMVIFTLVAVSWQAYQTKRAADATLAQAEIQTKSLTLQFRPRLRVRRISTDGGNVPQNVSVLIANVGSSDAHIIGGKAAVYSKANWDEGSGDELASLEIYPSVVKPGEELTVAVIPINDDAKFAWAVTSSNSTDLIRCQDNIQYADDAGVIRKTSFSRNYKRPTTNFTDTAYLEDEYED